MVQAGSVWRWFFISRNHGGKRNVAIGETIKAPAVLRKRRCAYNYRFSHWSSQVCLYRKRFFFLLLGAATVAFLVIEFIRFHSYPVKRQLYSFLRTGTRNRRNAFSPGPATCCWRLDILDRVPHVTLPQHQFVSWH